MTTIPMKTDYDQIPIRRYFNLAFNSEILFQNMLEYIENNSELVTITHPFEIVSHGKHQLISYNSKTFENNLVKLIELVNSRGKTIVFEKISDISTA